jgi:four helix bundle protein
MSNASNERPWRDFGYLGVRRASTLRDMPGARYDLEDRLINFAVQICLLTDRFPATPVAKHVSTQMTRSGTSPFANYGEAQAAESRQDFVHKLKVCLKELRETQAWLKFVERMNLCPESIEAARRECDELVAIFAASARTAARKCKMSNVQ